MTDLTSKPLHLKPIKRESVKDQALEQLRQLIVSGAINANGRLPSERDLAERLGVGRNSVREALKVLEALGLIESRIGEGTFVVAQTGATIGRAIGLSLAAQGGTLVELHDARLMIEASTVRAAATRATKEDLRLLADELHKMDTAVEFRAYLTADMNFHRVIAKASHNEVIWQIMTNLIDLLEATLQEIHLDSIGTTQEGEGTHHLVYVAILQQNPDAAELAMRKHLEFSTQYWQAIISVAAADTVDQASQSDDAIKRGNTS